MIKLVLAAALLLIGSLSAYADAVTGHGAWHVGWYNPTIPDQEHHTHGAIFYERDVESEATCYKVIGSMMSDGQGPVAPGWKFFCIYIPKQD